MVEEGKRLRRIKVVALLLLIVGLIYGYRWFKESQYRIVTDDAYVTGDMAPVSPLRVGTVVAVHASETDYVKKGEVLVTLGAADADLELEESKAKLEESVRKVKAVRAKVESLKAKVELMNAGLAKAVAEQGRRANLVKERAVSQEDYESANERVVKARLLHRMASHELGESLALAGVGQVEYHPTVSAAIQRVKIAYLNLRRSEVIAPVSGFIGKKKVAPGQRVTPGERLMAIIALDSVWVEANFKENKLKNLRIGQPVQLTSDLYGSNQIFRGQVTGIGAGTGSVFSLLPAQNASGNWIKIVQRAPVRISFDRDELVAHPLRLGMSMRAVIDTRDRSAMEEVPEAPSLSTDVYDYQIDGAEELVEAVIEAVDE